MSEGETESLRLQNRPSEAAFNVGGGENNAGLCFSGSKTGKRNLRKALSYRFSSSRRERDSVKAEVFIQQQYF